MTKKYKIAYINKMLILFVLCMLIMIEMIMMLKYFES